MILGLPDCVKKKVAVDHATTVLSDGPPPDTCTRVGGKAGSIFCAAPKDTPFLLMKSGKRSVPLGPRQAVSLWAEADSPQPFHINTDDADVVRLRMFNCGPNMNHRGQTLSLIEPLSASQRAHGTVSDTIGAVAWNRILVAPVPPPVGDTEAPDGALFDVHTYHCNYRCGDDETPTFNASGVPNGCVPAPNGVGRMGRARDSATIEPHKTG